MDQMKQCEPCLGMGYKGRYRKEARGKVWKIETCRACRGTGQVEATRRQTRRAARRQELTK